MDAGFFISLPILLIGWVLTKVIAALIIRRLYLLRKLFKNEFPDHSHPIHIHLANNLFPEESKLKTKFLRSSKKAENRVEQIFNAKEMEDVDHGPYNNHIKKLHALNKIHDIVVITSIILVVLVNIIW
ncbi:MAG: hypothetical protein MK105_06820 [Crocinitomicaceae bacterium]|nr:hypothetical protein [Crocinitomicaceae bacterium]